MNTIYSLAILFASFTFGLALIAVVMLLMGFGGAPGGILFEIGRKSQNGFLTLVGLILTAIGQAFVICAYAVFVVSALRAFSGVAPHIPTWPLWLAAFFHSAAVPAYAMKERPEVPSSQHMTLGIVGSISFVCFFIMVFSPQWLSFIFGWVPFFQSNIK
jgi:hypothetical protein